MEDAVGSGLLPIEQKAGNIVITPGVDPFLGGRFPIAGHAGRDLAGFTVRVDDVFSNDLTLAGDEIVPLARRRIPAYGEGDRGELTIVDAETRVTATFAGPRRGEIATELDLTPRDSVTGKYAACGVPANRLAVFNASYISFESPFHTGDGGELEIDLLIRSHPQQAFGLSGGRLKRHVFSTSPMTVSPGVVGTTVHAIDLPRRETRSGRTIYVDLADPTRYMPASDASFGDINADGVIEMICISAASEAGAPISRFGPLRFLSATNSDRDDATTALLVGGQIALPEGLRHAPAALELSNQASGETTNITLDRGFYVGKVPLPGLYRVRVIHPDCESALPAELLLERDSLDVDLSVKACSIEQGKLSQ
jgi:hypothetical protein